ncbi:hypothetical protein M2152_000927 [Microbacteriaceae bacterium SG_E_30_P1]|uniref:Uncharacterized protein n=1 Tax=Antiquaquibacter oligotrophicus TaxID=2880260 RepID=A0ABT6KM01_9MICO|nr:hypothetical protein [Antiquaquibacter oligotrophicus]MDH6180745.1 hypothetical protein [Antiquaquibacter oligotrophicus]UDF13530.1 hypothetical protein LH407_01365 [Antiquaquibacter oligotrophicus]
MRWTSVAWWSLVGVTGFSVLSALGGGVAMLVTNGLGMPVSALDGSVFDSFVAPSLVLVLVVGGTQALAMVLLVLRRATALLWSAVAGFAMVIWIIVETVVIRGFSVLQGIYLVTGLAQLALVIALLGVVSWVPRSRWGAPALPL